MNKSETITNLAKALAAFNTDVERIDKDGTNPHFKNRYSTLDNIIDHVKPLLAKHGLSVLQFPSGDGEMITLVTILVHTSGEFIESDPITMKPARPDPQGIGSCITYARRYSLTATLSLNSGDTDDDGHAASDHKPAAAPYKPPAPAAPPAPYVAKQEPPRPAPAAPAAPGRSSPVISQPQMNLINKLLKEKHVPDEEYRRMIAPKASTKDLTVADANTIITQLKAYVPFDFDSPEIEFP